MPTRSRSSTSRGTSIRRGSAATASGDRGVDVAFGSGGRIRLLLPAAAEFEAEDRALCAQLGVVGAAALARARLHEAEHDAVRRLQESLLPRELPTHPSLQLAVRYLPANATADVGGDWYDVISLPGGRLAAVVGDVVGHGMAAAATMSSLRNVLRAFLIEGDDAGQALARMHELANRTEIGLTATLCCVIIDPVTGVGDWASAGHPPPLLVRPRRTRPSTWPPAKTNSPALGVGSRPNATQSKLVVAPGEMLLLYTDGLVERRDRTDGAALLQSTGARDGIDLDTYCDDLIDRLAPADVRRDDVALLALRRTTPSESVLELRPFATVSAPAETRRRLRPWLAAHSFDTQAAGDVLVAVSEAVANSVEHSGISPNDQVTVRARLGSGRLGVTVRDTGRWRRTAQGPVTWLRPQAHAVAHGHDQDRPTRRRHADRYDADPHGGIDLTVPSQLMLELVTRGDVVRRDLRRRTRRRRHRERAREAARRAPGRSPRARLRSLLAVVHRLCRGAHAAPTRPERCTPRISRSRSSCRPGPRRARCWRSPGSPTQYRTSGPSTRPLRASAADVGNFSCYQHEEGSGSRASVR